MKKISILCAFCFVLSALAYTSEDLSNANYLADQGVITKQTVASKYRLDDKILRQEAIGMALKVKGVTLPENYKCKKYFADATKNDWACRAVELAADNGIITRSNKYANPGKDVTRAEALAMLMKAVGVDLITDTELDQYITRIEKLRNDPDAERPELPVNARLGSSVVWIQKLMLTAIQKIPGVYNPYATDCLCSLEPNRLATRAEVFYFAKSIIVPGLEKTFSNNLFSFRYPSRYLDPETMTISQITLEEKNNEVLVGGVPIFYYTNIYSDADILSKIGSDSTKSCKVKISNKAILFSGATLIDFEFSDENNGGTMCGRNFVYKTVFFASEGVLIDIHLGQGLTGLSYGLGDTTFVDFAETFRLKI